MLQQPPGSASVEDLAVGINAVSSSIETAGYGERLLCAVFAFKDAAAGGPIYFIYNYKRGYWYPFVPAGSPRPDIAEQRTLHRARAAAQGPDRPRTADRARTRALVPALGDPDLAGRAPSSRRSPVTLPAGASARVRSGRRQDQVGGLEVVVGKSLSVALAQVEQRFVGACELRLVPPLDGLDSRVLELLDAPSSPRRGDTGPRRICGRSCALLA